MANRKRSLFVLLGLSLAFTSMAQPQENMGFLGKKMAVGVGAQLSVPRYILGRSGAIKNNLYFEYATFKYQSITANIAYKKIKMPFSEISEDYDNNSYYSYGRTLIDHYNVNGNQFDVEYEPYEGVSEFRCLSFGVKYNFYYKRKTVASPVGFCQYLRIDCLINKQTKNGYKYVVTNPQDLTPNELSYANNTSPALPQSAKAVSIGYGLETKKMITPTVFVSFSGEINLNTFMFTDAIIYSDYMTREEDMRQRSWSIDMYKNIFLVGISIGSLL